MVAAKLKKTLKEQEARYTEGDCWVLAVALGEALGWRVVSVPGHAFVLSPDGKRALDITGIKTYRAMLRSWQVCPKLDAEDIEILDCPQKAKRKFMRAGWDNYYNLCLLADGDKPRRTDWKHAREMAQMLISFYGEKL
jgi:predicted amidohydrolase